VALQIEQHLNLAFGHGFGTGVKPITAEVAEIRHCIGRLIRCSGGLVVLSMGGERIDTRSPTGKLMLTMLGAIATFERDLMLERQREGIAKAAAEGKYKGRAPTARAKAADVLRLAKAGRTRHTIATDLGIGVASVYRILAEARATGAIAA
jgi:DNA invertase Pin-like site-specific DNA recombinase